MLLYFSATGNCKYVAQRLAAAYNEKAISILDCLHQEQYDFSESTIGIVFPTYFWGLPSLVQEFLEKASFQTDYLYFIATYGTTPGAAGHMAAQAIRGRSVDAFYSVRMPDTWTPLFDLSSPGKVAAFTKTTEAEIDTILCCVQSRYTNSHMSPRVPLLMAKCFAQPFYHSKARRTAHFHVEQSCIGCGLCQKICPAQAIRLENRKPVWVKEKCILCLGCLHRCPRFAIQYGKHTQAHGQYVNPHVKL